MNNFYYILLGILFATVLLLVITFLILAERKLLGLSQRRVGPSILGRRGFLQVFADIIKALFKEVYETNNQTVTLGFFSIYLLFVTQIFLAMLFEFMVNVSLYNNVENIIYLQLIISSVASLATFLIGYTSGTKYGIIGSVRLVIAELSIEVVMTLLNSVILYSTSGFDYESIITNQFNIGNIYIFGIIYAVGYVFNMFILAQKSPLDLIENEGELVAGYNTEYSGADVLLIYFSEYFHLFNAVIQFSLFIFGSSILFDIDGSGVWNHTVMMFTNTIVAIRRLV